MLELLDQLQRVCEDSRQFSIRSTFWVKQLLAPAINRFLTARNHRFNLLLQFLRPLRKRYNHVLIEHTRDDCLPEEVDFSAVYFLN